MRCTRTIGLFSAVLINVNIIVGGGIFINLSPLIKKGGVASFLSYLLAGVLLAPMVIVLAALARRHPESGGLYVYAKTYLHPVLAFVCGWCYFAGKQISVSLMAHLFMKVMQQVFPVLQPINDIVLVAGLLAIFVAINILGAELQGRVQWVLIAAKSIPILFAATMFFKHGSFSLVTLPTMTIDTYGAMLPIAVFAMIGFEVTCTLGHLFKDPDYTIMRALVIGFAIVVSILSIFQLAVAALVPAEQALLFPLAAIAYRFAASMSGLVPLLYVCVYTSMIGGAFSILTSNCWNLHRLAEQGHLPFRSWLIKVTKRQVPWVSLCIGACMSVIGLIITKNQGALQSMAIFGMIFAYTCAMVAAMFARDKNGNYLVPPVIKVAAFASCCYLMHLCLSKIARVGVSTPYLMLFGVGISVALYYEVTGKREATVIED